MQVEVRGDGDALAKRVREIQKQTTITEKQQSDL